MPTRPKVLSILLNWFIVLLFITSCVDPVERPVPMGSG